MRAYKVIVSICLLVILLGLTILVFSKSKRETAPAGIADASAPTEKTDQTAATSSPELSNTSIEEEWERLATSEFCFVGFQYYSPAREIDPAHRPTGEVALQFNPYGWLPSAKRDQSAAVEFLIKQIPDKRKTEAHVCPFYVATRGELAVYCLQHIAKKNWHELNEDYARQWAALPEDVTHQDLLRRIIKSKRGAKEMMKLWRAL